VAAAYATLERERREPNWPLVLKGLGETLGEEELRLGPDAAGASPWSDIDILLGGPSSAEENRCAEDASACFARLNLTAGLSEFVLDFETCINGFMTCVEALEEKAEARYCSSASTAASEAVLLLKSEIVIDLAGGTKKLAQAMKNAADGLQHKVPEVQKALSEGVSSVAEGVGDLMAEVVPPTLAFAKEVRTTASNEVAKGLRTVRKHLPDLVQKCKSTAERGAGAVERGAGAVGKVVKSNAERGADALEKAAGDVMQKLPELKEEAQRRGRDGARVAIEKTDALVKSVPKLASVCRSKFENKEAALAVNNAIVVGSAVTTGATVVSESEAQKVREEPDAMFLRLHSQPSDWKVALAAFDEGLWEEFGRAAGRAFRGTHR
jgi:hypothetical protein